MHRRRLLLLLGLVLLLSGILAACGGPAKGTAEWYLDQGNKLYEQGRYDEAIEEYNKAIELDPKLAGAYYNRACAYKEQGKKAEAIADFEKVVSLMNDTQLIEMARQQIEELRD